MKYNICLTFSVVDAEPHLKKHNILRVPQLNVPNGAIKTGRFIVVLDKTTTKAQCEQVANDIKNNQLQGDDCDQKICEDNNPVVNIVAIRFAHNINANQIQAKLEEVSSF